MKIADRVRTKLNFGFDAPKRERDLSGVNRYMFNKADHEERLSGALTVRRASSQQQCNQENKR